MEYSAQLVKAIKGFEGCKLTAYKCPAGVWTIGYGHTRGVKQGQTITQAIADALLAEDIKSVQKQLAAFNLPVLTQCQYDAVLDFCFNLGTGKFRSSTLCRKIMANPNDKTIPAEFKRWVYSGKTKLAGLVKRRNWEAQRWLGTL